MNKSFCRFFIFNFEFDMTNTPIKVKRIDRTDTKPKSSTPKITSITKAITIPKVRYAESSYGFKYFRHPTIVCCL